MKVEKKKQPLNEVQIFKISNPVSLKGNVRKRFDLNKEIDILKICGNQMHPSPISSSQPEAKTWKNELIEFSTSISQQANAFLDRIKEDFMKNGQTFDAAFRNHFLYIANNR